MNGIFSQGRVLKGVSVCVTCIFILLIWKGVPTSAGAFRHAGNRLGAYIPNIFGEDLPGRAKRKTAVDELEFRNAENVAEDDAEQDDAQASTDSEDDHKNATVNERGRWVSEDQYHGITNYTGITPIRRIIKSRRNRISKPRLLTNLSQPINAVSSSEIGQDDEPINGRGRLDNEIDLMVPDENIPLMETFLFRREPRTKDEERLQRQHLRLMNRSMGRFDTSYFDPAEEVGQRVPLFNSLSGGDHFDHKTLDPVDNDDDVVPHNVPMSMEPVIISDQEEQIPMDMVLVDDQPGDLRVNSDSSSVAIDGDFLIVIDREDGDENAAEEVALDMLELPSFVSPLEISLQDALMEITGDTSDVYFEALMEDRVSGIDYANETWISTGVSPAPDEGHFDVVTRDNSTDVNLAAAGQSTDIFNGANITGASNKVLDEIHHDIDDTESHNASDVVPLQKVAGSNHTEQINETDTSSIQASVNEQIDSFNKIGLRNATKASSLEMMEAQADFDNITDGQKVIQTSTELLKQDNELDITEENSATEASLKEQTTFDDTEMYSATEVSPTKRLEERSEFIITEQDDAAEAPFKSLKKQNEHDNAELHGTESYIEFLREQSELDVAERHNVTEAPFELLEKRGEYNETELHSSSESSLEVLKEQSEFDITELYNTTEASFELQDGNNQLGDTELHSSTESSLQEFLQEQTEFDITELNNATESSLESHQEEMTDSDNSDQFNAIDASLDVLEEEAQFDNIRGGGSGAGYFADYEDNQDSSSVYYREMYFPIGDTSNPTEEDLRNRRSADKIMPINRRRTRRSKVPESSEEMYDQVANEVQRDIGDDQEAEADFKKAEVEQKRHTWRHFKLVTATLIFVWMCWFIIACGLCRTALSMSKKSALLAEAQ